MKRTLVLTVASVLFALVTAAGAAPAGKGANPKPQGLKNAKKVMQARIEREKKMIEVHKQAQARKHQTQNGK